MIMLDTHALIWWRDSSSRLSQNAKVAIAQEAQGGKIGISAFSFWEIALLVEHNPADRIIVATAMLLDIPIVTADQKIHAYPHVQTIW